MIERLEAFLDALANHETLESYYVGGLVRDILLHKKTTDIDIAFKGDVDSLLSLMTSVLPHERVHVSKLSTVKFELGPFSIDLAQMRSEKYINLDGFPIIAPASEAKDLERRDFTVNTAYAMVNAQNTACVLAYLSGKRAHPLEINYAHPHFLRDLNNRTLSILQTNAFEEDPSRLLRALKYKYDLHFKMDVRTKAAFDKALADGAIKRLPQVRFFLSFNRFLPLEHWMDAVNDMIDLGLLNLYFGISPNRLDADLARKWGGGSLYDDSDYKLCLIFGKMLPAIQPELRAFFKNTAQLYAQLALMPKEKHSVDFDIWLYDFYQIAKRAPRYVLASIGYHLVQEAHSEDKASVLEFMLTRGLEIEAPRNGHELMALGIREVGTAKAKLHRKALGINYREQRQINASEIMHALANESD